MQLTYRGVAYSGTNTIVNTVDTNSVITYRGQSYTRCRPVGVAGRLQRNLVYRGVAYEIQPQVSNSVVSNQALLLN